VVAHPECTYAVRMLADEVCSTEKMIGYCQKSPAQAFSLSPKAHAPSPGARGSRQDLHPRPHDLCACNDCRYMKMNTLEKLRDCLDYLEPEIILPEDLRVKAERSVRRMLELSR